MASTAILPHLPVELLDAVADQLVAVSSSSDDAIASLLSLSQTNRIFHDICCPKLYRVDNQRYPLRSLAYALEENNVAVLDWLVRMEVATTRHPEREQAPGVLANSIISFRSQWVRAYGNSAMKPHGTLKSTRASDWVPIKGIRTNLVRPLILTPLLIAAESGKFDVCRYLVSHGADVNIRGDDLHDMDRDSSQDVIVTGPRTALQAALNNGHDEIALFLLEAGTNSVIALDTAGNQVTLLSELVRLRRPDLLRRMLDTGLVHPDEVRTARDHCLGGAPVPLLLVASAGLPDPSMVSLLLENGADATETLPIPVSLIRGPSSTGRWSWLSRSALSSSITEDTLATPTAIEAICNGGVHSHLRDQLTASSLHAYKDETEVIPDTLLDNLYQSLLLLLSHGGAQGFVESGRLHNCLQGLIDNALFGYRSDLDLGRFATAILSATNPPEFFPEASTTPFLLPYLLQSLITHNFPLLSALCTYIASPLHSAPHVSTIQAFLPIAARLIVHMAHVSPKVINTLTSLSLTLSQTWTEDQKPFLWFPGTRVVLPQLNPTQPRNHMAHFVHVPALMMQTTPCHKHPGPEDLGGVQAYNNGMLNGERADHNAAPSSSTLAALQAIQLLRVCFEGYLSTNGEDVTFWKALEEAKCQYMENQEESMEEVEDWESWTSNVIGASINNSDLCDDSNKNERIPFLLHHARRRGQKEQGGLVSDIAWHSWSVQDIQALSTPASSSPKPSEPFFPPGAARFKGFRETAATEAAISELVGVANVPELDFWIEQERRRSRRGW